MKHRLLLLTALGGLFAACTYNEYKTYNEVSDPEDAGLPRGHAGTGPVGAAGVGAGVGGAGAGQSGASGVAGAAGAAGLTGAAGATSDTADRDCTGCLRLTATPGASRDVRLEFASTENLSSTRVTWRMRKLPGNYGISMTFYAQSGDGLGEGVLLGSVSLDGAEGWQELGGDLTTVPSFTPPVFIDGGGVAGNGFDPGFPFDKTKVERTGVYVSASAQSGVFTPYSVEIDAVSFSNHLELNASFAATDGGFQLSDADGYSSAGATLEQVDD